MWPHEFDLLWRLGQESPRSAAALAQEKSQPTFARSVSSQQVASTLRSLIGRGFVEACDGAYSLTASGKALVAS